MRCHVVGLGSPPLGLGASPPPLPSEQCVRVEACACRSTAARGWHCDEGCARPRRARHGSARRAYQRQLSRHGNAYPGSSSEPGRRRRDATAAHSTSSARCPAVSPAPRGDGRRLARCSAPWPQTEERPRGVCDVRCGAAFSPRQRLCLSSRGWSALRAYGGRPRQLGKPSIRPRGLIARTLDLGVTLSRLSLT